MSDQAANSALAAISAQLHPGKWTKAERAEENLHQFNKWFQAYKRWTNVCLRGITMDDSMKWDVLLAAGGEDLDNVMKEAGIITEARKKVPEVPYRPYRPEIPRGPNGDPAGQEEQLE